METDKTPIAHAEVSGQCQLRKRTNRRFRLMGRLKRSGTQVRARVWRISSHAAHGPAAGHDGFRKYREGGRGPGQGQSRLIGSPAATLRPAASAFWQVGTGLSIAATTPRRLLAVDRAEARSIECGEAEDPLQRHITCVTHDGGDTYDTRYDAWESGGCSWCQGAVQEIELVPKTEVEAEAQPNRGERPPTGQSEEALRFHSRFQRRFQFAATKVPFSEVGVWRTDFRLAASKVPFSEVGSWRGSNARGVVFGAIYLHMGSVITATVVGALSVGT